MTRCLVFVGVKIYCDHSVNYALNYPLFVFSNFVYAWSFERSETEYFEMVFRWTLCPVIP